MVVGKRHAEAVDHGRRRRLPPQGRSTATRRASSPTCGRCRSAVVLVAYCLWAFEKAERHRHVGPVVPAVDRALRRRRAPLRPRCSTGRGRRPRSWCSPTACPPVIGVVWAAVFGLGVLRAHERRTAARTPGGAGGAPAPTAAEVCAPRVDRRARPSRPLDQRPGRGVVARGLGRSYGDAAQNAGGLVIDATGVSAASSPSTSDDRRRDRGRRHVSLDDLMRWFVPAGWFVPVTPGHPATSPSAARSPSDIHGKNHHARRHLVRPRALSCARHADGERHGHGGARPATPTLFWATAGGMGLTGVVLDATVASARSRPAGSPGRHRPAPTTSTTCMAHPLGRRRPLRVLGRLGRPPPLAAGSSAGRCITQGDFADASTSCRRRRRQPLAFAPRPSPPCPRWCRRGLLNRWRIQAFNEAWWRKAPPHRRDEIQTISRFFHPLDGVVGWNRLYGPRGFLQWQMRRAVRRRGRAARRGHRGVRRRPRPDVHRRAQAFGAANPGPLSFPLPGLDPVARHPGRDRRRSAPCSTGSTTRSWRPAAGSTWPRTAACAPSWCRRCTPGSRSGGRSAPGRPRPGHPERPRPPPRAVADRRGASRSAWSSASASGRCR